jgi:hypothetical protein
MLASRKAIGLPLSDPRCGDLHERINRHYVRYAQRQRHAEATPAETYRALPFDFAQEGPPDRYSAALHSGR